MGRSTFECLPAGKQSSLPVVYDSRSTRRCGYALVRWSKELGAIWPPGMADESWSKRDSALARFGYGAGTLGEKKKDLGGSFGASNLSKIY